MNKPIDKNPIDKNKELKEIQNSQASLVNALESIKGLLEESESKLSAARESLALSRSPKKTPKIPMSASTEPVVPVLDDIVRPGTATEPEPLPLFKELAGFEKIEEAPEQIQTTVEVETPEQPQTNLNTAFRQELLDCLESLRSDLKKEISQTLAQTVENIEADIKNKLDAQFQKLRDKINNAL